MKSKKRAPSAPFQPFARPAEIEALRAGVRVGMSHFDDDDEFINAPEPSETPYITGRMYPTVYPEIEDDYDEMLEDEILEGETEDDDDEIFEEETEDEETEHDSDGAFIIQSGAQWHAQNHDDLPPEAMLFGNLWMQHDLCILFADTNVGKSILAVQIADSISRGLPIPGMGLTAEPSPVLYFDFELSEQQFRHRYSSPAQGKYPFNEAFNRAIINPFSKKRNKFNSHEEFINNEMENAIVACKAKTLIIDNITCMRYGTQNAAGAHSLMQYLQTIKRRYQISILVLAHTPKRNPAKPLSRNDLQGSKMLINLADSAFAIGESRQQPGLRYLKQIKQRSAVETHGADNVCLATISRTGSFLHFTITGHSNENDHLAPQTEQYRRSTEHRVHELNQQGQSVRKIATQLGLAPTTVFRALKRIQRCEETECADVEQCADMQMCGCADEKQGGDEGRCADMQMCGCADEKTLKACNTEALEVRPPQLTQDENQYAEIQKRAKNNFLKEECHAASTAEALAKRGKAQACPEDTRREARPPGSPLADEEIKKINCHAEALEARPLGSPLADEEIKKINCHAEALEARPPGSTTDEETHAASTAKTPAMRDKAHARPDNSQRKVLPQQQQSFEEFVKEICYNTPPAKALATQNKEDEGELPETIIYEPKRSFLEIPISPWPSKSPKSKKPTAASINAAVATGYALTPADEIERLTYLAKYEPIFFTKADEKRLRTLKEREGVTRGEGNRSDQLYPIPQTVPSMNVLCSGCFPEYSGQAILQ